MFLHPTDLGLISDISSDSFIGNVCFRWSKQNMKRVMDYLGFQKVKKNGFDTYKKRIHTQGACSLVAYHNGKITCNGCRSKEEIKNIIRELVEKLSQINIPLSEKLKIVSFRCKIQYKVLFDIESLSSYIFERDSSAKEIGYKVEFTPDRSKTFIPEWIHNIKGLRLFVIRLGYIQIYKANLIENLQNFATNIYWRLLERFALPMLENKKIYKYNKHQHQIKNPIIKTVIIKDQKKKQQNSEDQFENELLEALQKNQWKYTNKNQFVRYEFEGEDLLQLQSPNNTENQKQQRQKQEQ